jgi:uncharacterized protein YdeI (YjbR/CyaY-like superfamily)
MSEPYIKKKNRDEFRKWLRASHTQLTAARVVFAKKNSGEQTVSLAEAVEEALCVGWIDGVLERVDEKHFAVRFTKRKPKSIWSKVNVERVERLIADGLMTPAGLAAVDAGKASGAYQNAYAVRDAVAEPPELKSHKTAQKAFAALSPGQRKAWTRWIAGAKRAATRKERIARALKHIKHGRLAGETDSMAARRKMAPAKKKKK